MEDPPSDNVAIRHLVEAAKRGNQNASRALLAEFVYWAEIEELIPSELSAYLCEAFTSIYFSGANPAEALNLGKKRGRPERTIEEQSRDLVIGIHVDRLMNDSDFTYESAIAEAADKHHVSERKAQREYRAFRSSVDPHYRDDDFATASSFDQICVVEDGDLKEITLRKIEALTRLSQSAGFAISVLDLQHEGVSEDEAVARISGETGKSWSEVAEALHEYDDWLMSL